MRLTQFLIITILFLVACKHKNNANEIQKSIERLNRFSTDTILTKAQLENENDSILEELVFVNIYANIKVDLKSTDDDYKRQFEKFTIPQKAFYSTLVLERQVKYFGFKGYFEHHQSGGLFAKDASLGYKLLGLTDLSEIVDSATNKSNLKDTSFAGLNTLLLKQIAYKNSAKRRLELVRNNIYSFSTKN